MQKGHPEAGVYILNAKRNGTYGKTHLLSIEVDQGLLEVNRLVYLWQYGTMCPIYRRPSVPMATAADGHSSVLDTWANMPVLITIVICPDQA
jgi:hypothetical protein